MKIINRKEFLSLPENILFSKYDPCYFHELMIKGESYNNDFWYSNINDAVDCNSSTEYGEILLKCQETGESFNMDFESQMRDGCFDEDQLFVIWEKKDVHQLINRLHECL